MKISTYLLSILFLLSISQLNSHGFEASMLVKTWDGFKRIEDISCNVSKHKKILSYNFCKSRWNSGYVRTAGKSVTNCYIKIQFTNPSSHQVSEDDILCTPAQEFYLPEPQEWVPACQLNLDDKLFSASGEKIAITGLELILQPLTIYAFEEERYHNFFVGTYGILTHNTTLPWQWSVVFSLPFGSEGAVAGGKAGSYFGPVGMVGGAILGGLFCWVAEKRVNENKLHHYSSVFDLEALDTYFKGNKSKRPSSPVQIDKSEVASHNDAQAPGSPTENDGYVPPKNWDGKKVRHNKTGQHGWPDKKGKVWVPTGVGSLAHGGPHWDVIDKNGGHENIMPGGKLRGQE